jgi:energy-coupling factor transporter ATP-binding protein EcfA2
MVDKVTITDHRVDRMHFKEASFEKLNLLFGGNGSGKTTLLNYIKDGLETGSPDLSKSTSMKYIVHSYYNSKDNNRHNNPNPYGESQAYTHGLVTRFRANEVSEGQSIIYSFSEWLNNFLESYTKDDFHVIILDEIDSGLSCDHVNVILHILNDNILDKDNVQIFVSSNMFHWVYALKRVFSMYEGEFFDIDSYEEYFRIQMDHQQVVGAKSDFNFL